MMNYIKNLSTYVSDISANVLGFAHDAEASALVLVKDVEIIRIQTEADHVRLGQDEDMER